VITSGRPFYQFQFLQVLKSKFPYIKTLGDYRDPWNTNTNIESSLKRKFFRILETPIEKKTTATLDYITTCSEGFAENIKTLPTNKEIHIITNGFEDFAENICKTSTSEKTKFSVAFVGSLYDNQKIEVFLNALINSPYKNNIKLIFYGLENQKTQFERIKMITKRSNLDIVINPWLEKTKMLEMVMSHDAMLMCGLKSQKGRHTAKFFDYLSFQKNIILCPSDSDILEAEIERLKIGVTLDDEEQVRAWLDKLASENFNWLYHGIREEIEYYTYKNQVKKLAAIIENDKI